MSKTASVARWRTRTVALRAVEIGSAGLFIVSGTLKLSGDPRMVQLFDAVGIGQWVRYLTGSIEVVSAVALLMPSLALYGALALIPTMIGAVLTHLFIVGGSFAMPLLLLAGMMFVAYRKMPLNAPKIP